MKMLYAIAAVLAALGQIAHAQLLLGPGDVYTPNFSGV